MERDNNVPGPTWSSIWIHLITRAVEEWRGGAYIESWNTTQELYSWLPQECKEETKGKIEEIKSSLQKIDLATRKSSYSIVTYQRKALSAKRGYLYQSLLEAHEAIEKSLEDHNWICKGDSVTPQVQHGTKAYF